MQDLFGVVIFAVVAVAAVAAVASLVGRGTLYEQIGKGALSMDGDPDRPRGAGPASAVARAEADEEIRQMLGARNARRRSRGEPELDVEAELSRLRAPAVDPALVEEVRSLVIARNARRARSGRPPLDVETEVARQLAEFGE